MSVAQSRPSENLVILVLVCGAIAISFSPIFVRLSELGPTATAFYRVAIAMPLMWVMMSREGGAAKTRTRQPSTFNDYLRLSLAGFFFAGDLVFWHWSLEYTSVANATLLANSAPVFVALGSWFIFKERFSGVFLMGLVMSLSGAVILMWESLAVGQGRFTGDMLGIVTAMFYASYILVIGRLRADFSVATIMVWSGFVTTALVMPLALAMGESLVAHTLEGWLVLAALALVAHMGGQGAVTYALAHLPSSFSSVVLLFQPAIAAVLAWAIFDEALSIYQGAGALVILGGVYLARQGSK